MSGMIATAPPMACVRHMRPAYASSMSVGHMRNRRIGMMHVRRIRTYVDVLTFERYLSVSDAHENRAGFDSAGVAHA